MWAVPQIIAPDTAAVVNYHTADKILKNMGPFPLICGKGPMTHTVTNMGKNPVDTVDKTDAPPSSFWSKNARKPLGSRGSKIV